ncbi:diguanylate phosphodiesterase [Marinomonas ushuaiensis DSM 15871]|uniref:Diguanylate phosphodiesterase n=1 Tax=Marinomonas ushuaiensis DSM 15871 TaxID=1122207 RepID=X7E8Z0_9GAMM|nr:EAL domain-containing protein [Marinomonas ushuaiensis]ETX12315.1 diguanylate phosphodiesterase [Marinomonas ushuaiensis DSM 15871]
MQIDRDVKQDEIQESLRLLYSNVLTSTAVSVLISSLFVFSHTFKEDYTGKLIWWAVMIVMLSLRLFDLAQYRKKSSQGYIATKKDLWCFSSLSFLVSSTWGAYPLFFHPFSDSFELVTTIIILCGIGSGVAIMWSANKATSIMCIVAMSVPYSALLLISGNSYERFIGTMGMTYAIAMSLTAFKLSNFTHKAIHLKSQNAQLLLTMEKKVELRTQEIYRLSNIDRLTGLLNRTAFLKELNQIVDADASTPFALLFIDLDGFKQVNDSLGHEVGDKVIRETASRIASLSQGPLPICRWGGDEFLVAYRYQDLEDLESFSQQLIHSISLPHTISLSKTWVGASIGVALYPQHGKNYDTLIQSADIAMYQQKRLEKGKVRFFNESLRLQIIRERFLSDRLVTAIDDNELRLVFQPIVKSKTEEVVGLEALLRWRLDGEEVSPVEFIPIAEQYGMIKSIGLWVLEEACQQILTLSKSTKNLTVSINVSIIQLQDKDFVTHVRRLLTQLKFEPSRLHIEITESVFATDKSTLMTQIKALQEMNIEICIDDFGTGYSSLASMQNLGVDIVKIDKSFIDKINNSGSNIVHAVMQISQSMGYQVVAEGVETLEQVNKLNEIGVHFLQGYYFSKPLEVEQLNNYLGNHLK